jgi:diaminohydroxyphosphoribosylaminopyrimidine deaminase/5-amino-6-(5-phosphoribosylamino)uracil reductase
VEVVTVACGLDDRPEPRAVAQLLAARGVQTVLLEGGRRLAGAWWEAGLIDKVACFLCPKVAPGTEHRGAFLAGGPALMGDALALREVQVRQCGPDVLMSGYTGDVY